MKQELITISSAVVLGALSRGATKSMLATSSNTVQMGVNGLVCVGTGFLAIKVKGTDAKASMLRGASIGASVAHGLELMKNIFSTPTLSAKLNPDTAFGRYMQKSVGLSGAVGGLNGYIDENGNYHEDGLGGYIDVNGNYVADGLNGYDENGNYVDGLSGYDEFGNYVDGLSGSEGLAGYDEYGNYDGLSGYDENGNYVVDGLSAYINENGEYMI